MSHWIRSYRRPTGSELLPVLIRIWRQLSAGPKYLVDAATPISQGFTESDWSELDFADTMEGTLKNLGAQSAMPAIEARLRGWTESGGEPCVGEIAELIAPHVSAVDRRPLHSFGRECKTAGLFLALRTVALESRPIAALLPSDLITPRLGRRKTRRYLERCAARLLPVTRHRGLAANTCAFATLFGAFCSFIGLAFLCGLRDVGLAWLGLAAISFCIAKLADFCDSGLPPGVRTFADLARRIEAASVGS
ncbi:MAG: hypothetical protein HZB38_02275 [Planctomycetes bacterium]|nr:hypothetical protein [Planctomycetota bacterium]